jgi:predicted Zn-dependent protease
VAKGSALFRAGKVKQAEALLRSASAADPNSATLHGALGELLLKEHNYEDSVQELGLATQQDPESPEYSLLLSEALIGWKHYGVAVEFLNAVRPKFGKEPQFHYDLGLAYYNMNKMNKAQGESQEALRLAPNLERAQFLLAACLASTGDSTKATDILHKLVNEHPSNVIYWATLGQVLGPTGGEGSAEAVRAVRHALSLAPRDPHTQYVAATVFVQTGNFADARPLLEHLEKVDPKVLAVHVQLARVYSRMGQQELARKETVIANELQKQSASDNHPPSSEQQGGGAEQR